MTSLFGSPGMIAQAQMLHSTSIHLSELLEKANSKLAMYEKGVFGLKKLLDLEMDTIKTHLQLDEKERSVEQFINKLLQIMEMNLQELIILLELSENENLTRKKATVVKPDSHHATSANINVECELSDTSSAICEVNEQTTVTNPWKEPTINDIQPPDSNNCPHCKRYFSTKRDLNRHIRTHTGEKPFVCKVCSKSFSRKDFLRKHSLVHTREKPHRCVECNKSFSQRSNLTKHMLIHSRQRNFVCNICNRGFNQLTNLQRHQLIHASKNQFPCLQCHKQFDDKGLLLEHVQLLHSYVATTST